MFMTILQAATMAATAPFALRDILSLLPLPRSAPKPPPRPPLRLPPNAPLLPLCPLFSPPPSPLSFRPRPTLHFTTSRPTAVFILLPTHTEASEDQKGGGFGWIGPSLPAEVLFACYPAASLANVLYAKSGYYNVQVVVEDDEPEDRLVERFRWACVRAGVFRECLRRRFFENKRNRLKRRAREAAIRRGREAARVAQIAGGFNPPFRQRGKKKKKKRKRPQLREAPADDEEEEDNWELPEGEIPYCR